MEPSVMSQGYKANRLTQILNPSDPPEEQPRANPISHILNPTRRQSRTLPLAEILNPVQEQAQAISLAQILNPAASESRAVTLSQILNSPRLGEDAELVTFFRLQNPIGEEPHDTPSETQTVQKEWPQVDNEPTSDDRVQYGVGPILWDGWITEPEKYVAKQLAEAITKGLQSDVEIPRAEFWRTLDADLSLFLLRIYGYDLA